MSDWLEALRKEAARTSQAQVARRLWVSSATISLVLKGTYPASTRQIEARVRGVLLFEKVACPVGGELPVHLCFANRANPTGPLAGRFKRACPECPQGKEEREDV